MANVRKRAIERVRRSTSKNKYVKTNKEVNKLYTQVYKQVREANDRIRKLEKTYGKDRWGLKKLSKLDTENLNLLTNKGRIRISKNMTARELIVLSKGVKDFLRLDISTVEGVERIKREQKKNIQKNLSNEDVDISDDEAGALYQMFDDRDFVSVITNYDIPPSELWVMIIEAKETNATIDGWFNIIGRYINKDSIAVDLNLKRSLTALYDRYIRD